MSAPALPTASPILITGFVVLAVALVLGCAAGVRLAYARTGATRATATRAAALAATIGALWLLATAGLAARGTLRFDAGPPTMLLAIVSTLAATVVLARSPLGARLAAGVPLAVLVASQGFRVAVELLLHRAYVEGLMPVQMSYGGRNFDVVSGLTALGLAAWLASGRGTRGLVLAWNALGLLLLANIVTIAMLSAPTPFRVFHNEPANVWITHAPWVWLPLVMVPAALLGHLLVYRRLRLPLPADLAHGASVTGAQSGTVEPRVL